MNKLREYYWAYRNKITNKLFGQAYLPARGKNRGIVLISYIMDPFTILPGKGFSSFHTNYWECYEMAKLFSERGYAVDIVSPKNTGFIPKKNYSVCLDTADNFQRWIKYLPKDCQKIYPILMTNWKEYNEAENVRLENLRKRRGFSLSPRRRLEPTKNPELADYLVGFGNKTIFASYKQFNKPIIWIPISAVTKYDFPEDKNWNEAKKNFLWIGGGGAVLKGLDLVLEAFVDLPQLELHVCGPIHAEKDFIAEYDKELNHTSNIHVYGRLDVTGQKFRQIIKTCGAVIYPSGGDGTSGAIVQAMHGGLVPIVSHETGLREDSGYIPITDPRPESVALAVNEFSKKSAEDIRNLSKKVWLYARKVYTRDEFSKAYAKFIDEILKI